MPDLGKLAWDAYSASVGGTTFDGQPLPKWHELGQRQRDGWAAAANAVWNAAGRGVDDD